MRCQPAGKRLAITLLSAFLFCGPLVLADEVVPLTNWSTLPFWSPHPSGEPLPSGTVDDPGGRPRTRESLAVSTSPLPFVAITPCRLADTRNGTFPATYGPPALAASLTRDFVFTDRCGIPATAKAVSTNLTVTNTLGPGFILNYPAGGSLPSPPVSSVNYVPGQTIANSAIVPLGTGGAATFIAGVSGTDLIIDVNGYYSGEGVVTSLNTLNGDVALVPGSNVTLTPAGQTLTIASSGGPGGDLPAGANGQTLRRDGSSWVASSILTNDGSGVSVAGPLVVTASLGVGVSATSTSNHGVNGQASSAGMAGVQGVNNHANGYGVYGISASGHGVVGQASAGGRAGVQGVNDNAAGYGVYGTSASGHGVVGQASAASRAGVQGVNDSAGGYGVFGSSLSGNAGYFAGTVRVTSLAGAGNRAVYSDANGVLTNTTSDGRLKTRVVSLADEVDVTSALSRLRGVAFHWDTSQERARYLGSQREIGLIAQEVEGVLPELVATNADGYKSVDYAKLTAFLVEVAKAQQRELSELRTELASLRECRPTERHRP